MLCKVALPLESVNEFQLCVIYQMKATEKYFSVVLYILLNKVIPSFDSVDEILKCVHSNESYGAVLSCSAVNFAVQGDFQFCFSGWWWPFKWALLSGGTVYSAVPGDFDLNQAKPIHLFEVFVFLI